MSDITETCDRCGDRRATHLDGIAATCGPCFNKKIRNWTPEMWRLHRRECTGACHQSQEGWRP